MLGNYRDLGNPVADASLNAGLSAWLYGTPERSGASRLPDIYRPKNDAVLVGPTWRPTGRGDMALVFDGSNDYVTMGGIDATGTKTLSLWFYSNDITQTQVFFYASAGFPSVSEVADFLVLGTAASKLLVSVAGIGGTTNSWFSATLATARWYRFTVSKVAGGITGMWVDGVPTGAPSGGSDWWSGETAGYILGDSFTTGSLPVAPFGGRLSDLRFGTRPCDDAIARQDFFEALTGYPTGLRRFSRKFPVLAGSATAPPPPPPPGTQNNLTLLGVG